MASYSSGAGTVGCGHQAPGELPALTSHHTKAETTRILVRKSRELNVTLVPMGADER